MGDVTTRGRFGLPPEPEGRAGLASPGRAFAGLASAALIIWLLAWMALELRDTNASSQPIDRAEPRSFEVPSPTQEEALTIFESLFHELRSGPGRLLAPGLSVEALRRDIPLDGKVLMLELLWRDEAAFRIRQALESRDWDIDISGSAVAVKRGRRRLGIEWTVAQSGTDWRITDWAVVEDRVLVGRG